MESPDIGSASDSSDDTHDNFADDSWSFPNTKAPESYPSNRASSAKRRFGPGIHGPIGARDVKSRRREEPGPSRKQGGLWMESGYGGQMMQTGKKEELIDSALVETLRQRFGDPFDDRPLKQASK
ncbi:hypothetical protein QCA50_006905 [Cerrena zonata]|uniref:Uncharacterized protein n=1 Tax=Cerrena zonata TaxID=2478898 RepID=A0AAW0GMB7_9APHY